VALVGLDKVEVRSKTLGETIVTVELKLGTNDGVTTGTLGSKTGVVSTTGSLVVIGEVDGALLLVPAPPPWGSWLTPTSGVVCQASPWGP